MDSQWLAGIVTYILPLKCFPLSQTNKYYKSNFSLWQDTQMDVVSHHLLIAHHISK